MERKDQRKNTIWKYAFLSVIMVYCIKIDLRGIGWGDMEWIHVAEDKDQ
jgi:hypothetical protein